MSKAFTTLLRAEFRNQLRINNLIKYLFLFIAFCSLSITFISTHQDLQEFGVIFSVICIPLAQLNLSSAILKDDVFDGTIESLMIVFSSKQIVLAKFICLASCTCLAFILNLPILGILYSLNVNLFATILLCGALLAISNSALLCLIAAIQCYFRSNTNFISILIMPIIIPNIILSGLALQNTNSSSYLAILFGITLIISPIAILLAKHLIKNIYNI